MSWSYSSGTLSASGGSESSPNLISDGVEEVISNDASKGKIIYAADGSTVEVCKLIDVEVKADAGAWIGIDADIVFVLQGSSHFTWTTETSNNANDGGSLIIQERATIYVDTNTNYTESTTRFNDGCSCVIKQDEFGVSPKIILKAANRHDIITFPGTKPNKVDIQGLNIHQISGANPSLKWFMNYCRNLVNFKDITFDSNGEVFQLIYVTINNPKVKTTALASTSRSGAYRYVYVNNPTYIWPSDDGFDGNIRSARWTNKNPVWANGKWDGTVNWGAVNHSNEPRFWIVYENTIKVLKADDSSPLSGVTVYLKRTVDGTDYYSGNVTDHSETYTESTDSNGEVVKNLLDAYCQVTDGNSTEITDVERYKWDAIARQYNYRYTSHYVYQGRVYASEKTGGTGPKTDTVFMATDTGVTLSEAAANNLTEASDLSELYDIFKAEWVGGSFWDYPQMMVPAGSSLDLGSDNLVLDTTASTRVAMTSTTLTMKASSTVDSTSKFTTIKASQITFEDNKPGQNVVLDGEVYLNSAQDLSNVTITGDLYINTGVNTTLTFSGISVTGDIYNDDSSHTLTIRAFNSLGLSAGDPGTGAGQTNLQTVVYINVVVKDVITGDPVEGARVFLKTTGGTTLVNSLTNANGEVSVEYNYTGDTNIVGRVRKASQPPYYKTSKIEGTVTSAGFNTTIMLLKDE